MLQEHSTMPGKKLKDVFQSIVLNLETVNFFFTKTNFREIF